MYDTLVPAMKVLKRKTHSARDTAFRRIYMTSHAVQNITFNKGSSLASFPDTICREYTHTLSIEGVKVKLALKPYCSSGPNSG